MLEPSTCAIDVFHFPINIDTMIWDNQSTYIMLYIFYPNHEIKLYQNISTWRIFLEFLFVRICVHVWWRDFNQVVLVHFITKNSVCTTWSAWSRRPRSPTLVSGTDTTDWAIGPFQHLILAQDGQRGNSYQTGWEYWVIKHLVSTKHRFNCGRWSILMLQNEKIIIKSILQVQLKLSLFSLQFINCRNTNYIVAIKI